MKYELLKAMNPALDIEHLLDLIALYRGGKDFRKRIGRFLCKNEFEEEKRYQLRQKEAPYRSYVGPIIDKFAATLISAPPNGEVLNEKKEQQPPEKFWLDWRDNVDGNGTDLSEFMREQFTDALMKCRSMWVVLKADDGGNEPVSKAEYEERKLGNITLKELETQDVLDWECDASGSLSWLIHREVSRSRPDPRQGKRDMVTETYTVYDREKIETYEVVFKENEPPADDKDILVKKTRNHPLGQIPIVVLALPAGLCVSERVEDNQVEHFRLNAALSWAIKTTCYAMPVFKLIDGGNPPQFGSGKGIILDALDEIDWLAPPVQHLAVIAEKISTEKDEIYRVVHQMADGVNNNAGTVGRSAASKSIDAGAIRVIMESYSVLVRDATLRTYELATAWRGEQIDWVIKGMDEFSEVDLAALLEISAVANDNVVPSEMFKIQFAKRIVDGLFPNIDEATRSKIHQELEEGIKRKAKQELEDRDHEVKTREAAVANEAALAHALNRSDSRGMNGSVKSKRTPNAKKDAGSGGRSPAAAAA